jgi:3-phosphoshikimate 1-carboxyvinyltransferase
MKIVDILERMGATITKGKSSVTISVKQLYGIEIDLNDTPDLLPILSVVGCFAEGRTSLLNVPQARIKETDRIFVMCSELRKMGAQVEELSDGMIIQKSTLLGTLVDGHCDHRIIMSLACAGLSSQGKTLIENAGHTDVTFPKFIEKMNTLGAQMMVQ